MATYNGTGAADTITGSTEADTINGLGGNDVLIGGDGNDVLSGGDGDDSLLGGAGADTLIGGLGNDTLDGGTVIDPSVDFNFASYFGATKGINLVYSAALTATATAADASEVDTLLNIAHVRGTEFDDTIIGSASDVFEGIEGGGGNDSLDGGAISGNSNSFNRVTFVNAGSAVAVNLATGSATGTTTGTDTLANFRNVRGSGYNDVITGDNNANRLEGQGGDDTILGGIGNDNIDGGIGNDSIDGGADNDSILGGDGNDFLGGGNGNDTIRGGNGQDSISGGDGDDVLQGDGNDAGQIGDWVSFLGATGPVTVNLVAGSASGWGNDILGGFEGVRGSIHHDSITGSAGNDFLQGDEGDDTLSGGDGFDYVDYFNADGAVTVNLADNTASGAHGADVLSGFEAIRGSKVGAGDTLIGNSGNNTLRGELGDDTITGGDGFDTADYISATGAVTVSLVTNTSSGADGADVLSSIEAIRGSGHNDTLTGDASANNISGGNGDDVINGGGGGDTLDGNAGADSISGDAGNDFIQAADGANDTIDGGADYDTVSYSFSSATGVTFTSTLASGTQSDALGGTDSLSNIEQMNISGAAGADTFTGGVENNYIQGSGGNDTLTGGGGSDSFGYDVTFDQGIDRITDLSSGDQLNFNNFALTGPVLSGDTPGGLTLGQVMVGSNVGGITKVYVGTNAGAGHDLTIELSGTYNVADFVIQSQSWGTALRYETGVTLIGGAGDETLSGGSSGDSISGLGGNDTLNGNGGSDTLDGGEGNDWINGGPGNDSIVGGAGDDYIFAGGDYDGGSDTIEGGDGNDTAQYSFYGNVSAVTFVGTGATGVQIDPNGGTDTYSGIEQQHIFGSSHGDTLSGDSLSNYIQGNGGNDTLTGGGGSDTFAYEVGQASGTDRITDFGNGKSLYFRDFELTGIAAGNDPSALTQGQVMVSSFDGTLTRIFIGTNGAAGADLTVELEGNFAVTDFFLGNFGGSWSLNYNKVPVSGTAGNDTLSGGTGPDTISGLGGNDNISGGGGDDSLLGGDGDDYITGGLGNDYIDGGADNDWIFHDNATSGIVVNLTGNSVTGGMGIDSVFNIEHVGGTNHNDTITGNGVGNVLQGRGGDDVLDGAGGNDTADYFHATGPILASLVTNTATGDGTDTFLSIENLTGSGHDDSLTGDLNANRLTGGAGNDTLTGNDGNDFLDGGDGNDSLLGGVGADTLHGGSGNDHLDGGTITDTVNYTDLNWVQYYSATAGVNVNLQLGTASDGLGGTDTLLNINWVSGSNQNDLLTGTNSGLFEQFDGGLGDDTIDGGTIDPLNGGTANRASYASAASAVNVDLGYAVGEGRATGGAGTDKLLNINHVRGSNYNDVLTGSDATAYVESFNGGDGIDVFDGKGGIDQIRYDTGSVGAVVSLETGTASNDGHGKTDTLTGIEYLRGGNQNDTFYGNGGANLLEGFGGNDTLDGAGGNDTLTGGAGDDSLTGGPGNDLFRFGASGNGIDMISDFAAGDVIGISTTLLAGKSSAGNGSTVTAGNVEVSSSGGVTTLWIDTNNTAGAEVQIKLNGTFAGDAFTITTSGGASSIVGSTGVLLNGTSSADTLTGNTGNDTINGLAGNDNINGGAGNDVIDAGDDNDYVTAGGFGDGGSDTIDGGAGYDTVSYNFNGAAGAVTFVATGLSGTQVDPLGGTDTLSNFEELQVFGSAHGDTLTGGGGRNRLQGNGGNDTLTGGGGDDVFAWDIGFGVGTLGVDRITDLNSGDTLTVTNYAGAAPTLQTTVLQGDSTAAMTKGQVMVGAHNSGTNTTKVYVATDDTAGADLTIDLQGSYAYADFRITQDGFGGYIRYVPGQLINGDSGSNNLQGGQGHDTINGLEGNDNINGQQGDDLVNAGDGDDYISAGGSGEGGNDTINGGDGNDIASYYYGSETGAITFTATGASGTQIDPSGGTDVLTSIEEVHVTGGSGSDTLTGDSQRNHLQGLGGNDTLTGGGGNDTFAYDITKTHGIDRIVDLQTGDSITVHNAGGGFVLDSTFLMGDTATGLTKGQVMVGTYNSGTNVTKLYIATDATAGADLTIELQGDYKASAFSVFNGSFGGNINYTTGQTLTGDGNANNLVGGNGPDTISGLGGNDNIGAGGGDDSVLGGDGDDYITGGLGNDYIDGGAGNNDWIFHDSATTGVVVNLTSNSVTGGMGTDSVFNIEHVGGTNHNDTITGNGASNVLQGRGGDDLLDGQGGTDTVDYFHATGPIVASLVTNTATGDGTDTFLSIENLTGSAQDDSLTGDMNANRLTGGAGNDTLTGNDGNDFLDGGDGNDSLLGGVGQDTLHGGAGNDHLDGGTITDVVNYTDLNWVQYYSATAGVSVNLELGTASDGLGGTDALFNINWVSGSNQNDTITGSNGPLFEQFDGGAGDDTIDGGTISATGANRASYASAGSAVTVDLGYAVGEGRATGGAGTDKLLNINHVRGSNYNDVLTGSDATAYVESFNGGDGIDVIDGKGGIDQVRYDTGSVGAVVSLEMGTASNDGHGKTDTLANIENLRGGNQNDTFYGNGGANLLEGFGGNDTLDGADGNDTLSGGAGDDSLTGGTGNDAFRFNANGNGVDTIADFAVGDMIGIGATLSTSTPTTGNGATVTGGNVQVSASGGVTTLWIDTDNIAGADIQINLVGTYAASTFVVTDQGGGLSRIARVAGQVLNGTTGADVLAGGVYNDTIYGLAGNDTLSGAAGVDVLDGGADTDTVTYAGAASGVTVQLYSGQATNDGQGGTDSLIGIENVIGSGFGDRLDGNNGVNVLDGGVGSDSIYGFDGADTLLGGDGADVLDGGDGADSVVGGDGADTLLGQQGSDVLSGGAGSDTVYGGAGNDTLSGGAGNDLLDGGADSDTVSYAGAASAVISALYSGQTITDGDGGSDTLSGVENLIGSAFGDRLDGNNGANVLDGGVGSDSLFGFDGNDTLVGGDDADLLDGGAGADSLDGGAGNDTLNGGSGSNTLNGGAGIDRYVLTAGASDSVLGFIAGAGGDQLDLSGLLGGFTNYGGGNPFATGHVRLVQVGLDTVVEVDADGSGAGGFVAIAGLAGVTKTAITSVNFVGGYDPNATGLTLVGTAGADALNGTGGNDTIYGLAGNDTLSGAAGVDVLDGGADTDTVTYAGAASGVTVQLYSGQATNDGQGGTDSLIGIENVIGSGFGDRLDGNNGVNVLDGGVGSDSIYGFDGADTLLGGDGADVLDGGDGADSVVGGDGADTLLGQQGSDVLSGGAGSDTVYGGAGNDTLSGGAGNDLLDGGADSDTVSYAGAASAVISALYSGQTITDGDGGSDTLSGVENLIGSAFGDRLDGNNGANVLDGGVGSDSLFGFDGNDTLVGGDDADLLDGGAGADSLDGGAGNDTLNGGSGSNTLNGGAGIDRYVLTAGASDSVLGFIAGAGGDQLDLSGLLGGFTNYGGGNPFATGHVRLVQVGLDTVVEVDADGSGAGGFVAIAGLAGVTKTAITSVNFVGGYDPNATGLTLVGTAGADALNGTGGNDTIYGLAGNDTLSGAAGVDVLDGGADTDTVTYAGAASGVTVQLYSGQATNDGQGGTDSLIGIENVIGSGFGDRLDGNNGVNVLDGGVGSDSIYGFDGADTLLGGDGADVLDGGDGADSVVGGDGADTLLGQQGSDVLSGGAGSDTVYGGAGNDTLSGGAGNDLLDGGADSDTVSYAGAASAVISALYSGQTITDGDGGSDTLSGVENLIGSAFGDRLDGNNGANVLDGGVGSDSLFGFDGNDTLVGGDDADLLDGGAGADSLDGGAGNDTLNGGSGSNTLNGGAGIDRYVLTAGASDSVLGFIAGAGGDQLDLSGLLGGFTNYGGGNPFATGHVRLVQVGLDTVVEVDADGSGAGGFVAIAGLAGVTKTAITSVNFVGGYDPNATGLTLVGTAGADALNGTGGNDTIYGLAGNDTLSGAAGVDVLDGGADTDTVTYAGAASGVTVQLYSGQATNDGQGGTDSLIGIENVIGSGFGDRLDGNNGVNVLDGGVGSDSIYGFDGADTLLGGDGADVLDGGDGADSVVGGDGADTLLGQQGSDVLSGGAGSDTVYGGAGNDTLSGGAGNDLLDGGADSDTVSYAGAASAVISALYSGQTITDGDGGSDTLSGVENLIGSAFGDRLDGNNGANVLDGGVGSDSLFGFDGNDTLVGGDDNDVIDGGGGADDLAGGDGADTLLGQIGDDILDGGAGADTLYGVDGNDTLSGGSGNDLLDGGVGADTGSYVNASAGVISLLYSGQTTNDGLGGVDTLVSIENLIGSAFNDRLDGTNSANNLSGIAGNDIINGYGGDDTLTGGGGNDVMAGGANADVFAFDALSGVDSITDFSSAQLDKIRLKSSVNGSSITDGTSALAATTDVSGNAVINLGGGNTVTLVGVLKASLSAADFEMF